MRHTACMEVNLRTLQRNVEKIRRLAPKAKLCPMVKGNAYGHGMPTVSEFLVKECNVKRLGVASLGEAAALVEAKPKLFRRSLVGMPHAAKQIVVHSDTELRHPAALSLYKTWGSTLLPVVGTLQDLDTFLSCKSLRKLPLFLKIDTGMNRLGIPASDVPTKVVSMLRAHGRTEVQHLMQHFGNSSGLLSAHDRTLRQVDAFTAAHRLLEAQGVSVIETSLSNSGAIEQGIGVDATYVRPGLMMYGPWSVSSSRGPLWSGRQVSQLKAKIIRSFIANAGEFVGYGFEALEERSVVAVLNIGYADGFLRYFSGLPVTYRGLQGVVHGRVCMDTMMITFNSSTNQHKSCEAMLQFIMRQQEQNHFVSLWPEDLKTMAERVGTNTYEIMCAPSIRVPRLYVR